ncbi:MAG: glycosyltransferase WbuB [Spartobacteria bacterium]|nr:glycosyltransferase WbuB [Spartobacteria bacterium]
MIFNHPKRLCIVRHGFYPNDPRVFKEVRALVEDGYKVDVICLRKEGDPLREIIDGVTVYRMSHSHRSGSAYRYLFEYMLSLLMMGTVLTIRYFCRHYRCVQVNTLPDGLVFITLIPRLFGAKIILDMHEPTPELMMSKYDGNVSKRIMVLNYWIEKQAIRYAHQVITVNDTIRSRFIERGAEASKMHVLRNVPPETFGRSAAPPVPHKGTVIITHGTMQKRYGHHILIAAMPLLRAELHDVKLIIAGCGDTREELLKQTAALHCEDIVIFTGLVSRESVTDMITSCDMGIVPLAPCPFSDLCQPNKLFEYIALKVPAVAPRLPAIEESFDDSCVQYFTAGDTVDLAEKIIDLATHPEKGAAMVQRAEARYQQLCWNKEKIHYVNLVEQLIGPPGTNKGVRHERSHHLCSR